ncbi:glycosyltransferase family 2 protein [Azospirillum oryzae]|nr:glycosyltransferase family 2 protein [Azospirillum oryzae]GLR82694.1 hypothetical protein GCM10007856_53950 [Azospirillum oryzae]
MDAAEKDVMEQRAKDRVSICIPTRNRPNLLRELLDTVFAQTYGNYEVIITDNSDNDETRDLVAARYADPRVRYHKNETNLGMDGNARRAFSFITGEFFTFTADDDFWDADNLRRKVDLLRRVPEVNACFSNAHHILMDGRPHPQPFHTTLRPGMEAVIDGYYLNPVSLHFPPSPPLFVNTLTGLYRTAQFLAPMVESWECGSEEYAHWYLGLSGQRLGYLFDPLITIRDGEHNWEIQTGNGAVTNYRKSPEVRAAQLNRIYTTLRARRGAELTRIDRQVELAVFTFLVEQIGQAAVQYIGSFPLITVADFNAYIQERNRRQAAQAQAAQA